MKKGIGHKLSLYTSGVTVSEEKTEVSGATGQPARGSIIFENLEFLPICEGVYKYTEIIDTFKMGTFDLKEQLPAPISAILELSLLSLRDLIEAEDLLFLDTETTGLTRGVGNIPFLTGLGWFRDKQFHLELYFLKDPGDEDVYLDRIVERMNQFPYLVSYNGKSFDIPVLRNRLILNRTQNVGSNLLHFDLLHIFRRLIPSGGISGYRQKDLEQEILGFTREGDIPGEQIPQIYFDYLKYEEDTGLSSVFKHNRLDVLGMAFLFLRAVRLYSGREASTRAMRTGIARILFQNRRYSETVNLLEDHIDLLEREEASLLGSIRYKELLVLAFAYRKLENWSAAYTIFLHMADRYGCEYSRVTTWKILEHKLKRPDEALRSLEAVLNHSGEFRMDDIQKRKQRLMEKVRRMGGNS